MLNGASYNRAAVNQAKTNVLASNAGAAFSATATSQLNVHAVRYGVSNAWDSASSFAANGGRLKYASIALSTTSSTVFSGIKYIGLAANLSLSASASLASNLVVYRYAGSSLAGTATFTPAGFLTTHLQSSWDGAASSNFAGQRKLIGQFSLSAESSFASAGARGLSIEAALSAQAEIALVAELRKQGSAVFTTASSTSFAGYRNIYASSGWQALGQSSLVGLLVDRSPAPLGRIYKVSKISGASAQSNQNIFVISD